MKKIIAFIALLFLMLPSFVLAADFRTETVPSGENVRNLYVSGQTVTVDANVQGDLTAAGSIVNVNGNVEKAVQLAGSVINLKGNVGDNARVAGGTVNIEGDVGEDLVIFGGQVTLGQEATVQRDIIIAGGTVVINGRVNGKVIGNAGQFTMNGTVAGDVRLDNVGQLTLGPNAQIGGKLTYSSQNRANIDENKVQGGVEFKQVSQAQQGRKGLGALLVFSLISLIGSFLLIWLLVNVAPLTSRAALEVAVTNPWVNMGIGFVTLVVVPVVLILLLVSIIGIPIAGILFLTYVLLLFFSGPFSALILGSWLFKVLGRRGEYPIYWLPILVGVVLLLLLNAIPFLGWIVSFLLFLLAFGALTRLLYFALLDQREAA